MRIAFPSSYAASAGLCSILPRVPSPTGRWMDEKRVNRRSGAERRLQAKLARPRMQAEMKELLARKKKDDT